MVKVRCLDGRVPSGFGSLLDSEPILLNVGLVLFCSMSGQINRLRCRGLFLAIMLSAELDCVSSKNLSHISFGKYQLCMKISDYPSTKSVL